MKMMIEGRECYLALSDVLEREREREIFMLCI